MLPRYVRFTRALALGAGLVGCARADKDEATLDASPVADSTREVSRTTDSAEADTFVYPSIWNDTAPDEVPVFDSARDPDVVIDADATGTCRNLGGGSPVTCSALRTCVWGGGYASFSATCADAPGAVCGIIQCGTYCTCTNEAMSECTCSGPVPGPLPPPDLATPRPVA
jgi:hypothetical protein